MLRAVAVLLSLLLLMPAGAKRAVGQSAEGPQPPNPGECHCIPEAEAAQHYSVIRNASLCLSTIAENVTPYCLTTIYCLSDEKSGPDCGPVQRANKARESVRSNKGNASSAANDLIPTLVSLFTAHQQATPGAIDFSPDQLQTSLGNNTEAIAACLADFAADRRGGITGAGGNALRCGVHPSNGNFVIVAPAGSQRSVAFEFAR